MGKPLNSSLFEPSVTNMGHMFALFIQEPSGSRYTALGPGRGPERTAHCRDAGPAPRRLRGRTGGAPAAPGPLRDAPDFPRGRRGRQGEAATAEPRGRRAGGERSIPAGPPPLPGSPGAGGARWDPLPPGPLSGPRGPAVLGGTGAAAPPARPSFPWQSLAAGSAATPAPPRRRALRAACAAPRTAPAPALRVNKVAVGGVEEANCPGGGSGSRGSRLAEVLPAGLTPAAGPGCAAGGGRALRVWCVRPPPTPRALSVPPWEQALPTQGGDRRSCPAAARSLTHITDTHT